MIFRRAARPHSLLLSTTCFLGLSLWGTISAAHEADYPQEGERYLAPTLRPEDMRSPQFAALELRLGPYRPNVDDEFGSATPFADVFGTGSSVHVALEFDWQVLRIPYFGSLGPGVSAGYVHYGAEAFFADGSGRSMQKTSLWIVPLSAVGVLRIDVLAHELGIPLVPYGKFGINYSLWQSRDAGKTSKDSQGVSGFGGEWGLQAQLGLMLHLNFFSSQMTLDLDNATGVNHAYLFIEWLKSDLYQLTDGLQTGTSTWVTGLTLEF